MKQVVEWLTDDARFFVQTLRLIWVYCHEPIGKTDYTDDEFAEGYAAFSLYQKINAPSEQLQALSSGF